MRGTLDRVETRECVTLENQGQQIFGMLHRPTMVKKPPLVVMLHGFASSKLGSNRCYVTLAEMLAKENIASLRFDFRGAGDSEGNLSELTFEDLVSDAISVLENLESLEEIDSSRVGLFGASLGGTLAILAAAETKKAKAMVLWAPVASGELWFRDFLMHNPQAALQDPNTLLSTYRGIALHPQFREQFGKMAAFKMMPHLHSIPILHMHGERDEVISISHQDAYRKVCEKMQNVHFLKYPDGEHSLGFSQLFSDIMSESIEWYKRHL